MLLLEGGEREETLDLLERWDYKDRKVEWNITNIVPFLHFSPQRSSRSCWSRWHQRRTWNSRSVKLFIKSNVISSTAGNDGIAGNTGLQGPRGSLFHYSNCNTTDHQSSQVPQAPQLEGLPTYAGEEPLATALQEHNCSTAEELLGVVIPTLVVGPTTSVFLTTQSS